MRIIFNGTEYEAIYNKQSGYYEIQLTAPESRWSISYSDRIYRFIG